MTLRQHARLAIAGILIGAWAWLVGTALADHVPVLQLRAPSATLDCGDPPLPAFDYCADPAFGG